MTLDKKSMTKSEQKGVIVNYELFMMFMLF